MTFFGITYDASDWRFFIEFFNRSLKGVLLHNGNIHPSIPVVHSVSLKETYENIKLVIDKVCYSDHGYCVETSK